MNGLHLTADLIGCTAGAAGLADPAGLRALCLSAVSGAGLRPVGDLFHAFPAPGGVTGVVLLAESHLALHTWPEVKAVTIDVYVCNVGCDNSQPAQVALDALVQAFAPVRVRRQRLARGDIGAVADARAAAGA